MFCSGAALVCHVLRVVELKEQLDVSFSCNFSTRVNDTHLFVALNDHWIEETTSFKKSKNFLTQILMTTCPSANEADYHSTACFYERDTCVNFRHELLGVRDDQFSRNALR